MVEGEAEAGGGPEDVGHVLRLEAVDRVACPALHRVHHARSWTHLSILTSVSGFSGGLSRPICTPILHTTQRFGTPRRVTSSKTGVGHTSWFQTPAFQLSSTTSQHADQRATETSDQSQYTPKVNTRPEVSPQISYANTYNS